MQLLQTLLGSVCKADTQPALYSAMHMLHASLGKKKNHCIITICFALSFWRKFLWKGLCNKLPQSQLQRGSTVRYLCYGNCPRVHAYPAINWRQLSFKKQHSRPPCVLLPSHLQLATCSRSALSRQHVRQAAAHCLLPLWDFSALVPLPALLSF